MAVDRQIPGKITKQLSVLPIWMGAICSPRPVARTINGGFGAHAEEEWNITADVRSDFDQKWRVVGMSQSLDAHSRAEAASLLAPPRPAPAGIRFPS